MKALSERMLKSGWILHKSADATWTALSPRGYRETLHKRGDGQVTPSPDLLREITEVERLIETGGFSRYLGTSRRLQPPLPPEGAPLAQHLARRHIARGHAVLRFRSLPDPAGDQTLLDHGAWRVETLSPPWQNTEPLKTSRFTVFTCEHLLDTLPRLDRRRLLAILLQQVPKGDGVAYFTVLQMSALPKEWLQVPSEDGYQIQYGHNLCFVKPYNEAMLRRELAGTLPGDIERAWIQHHELTYSWRPHA